MENGFDFSKEYGVVLEGGGAKGAYQIGVWKALLECGIKIKGVSGVSVGALNGALICMGDYQAAEDLWKSISYSSVMQVNDVQMDKLIKHRIKELDISEIKRSTAEILSNKGINVTPLKELIEERVDEEKIRNSPIEFIMGTFSVSDRKELEITAWEAEEGYLKDYLLASSYLPAFQNEKLHGKKYLDGGMFNNVPVDMLINRGYRDILVVRIYGIGMEKRINIPKDVNVIQIAPRVDLGGILEFDREKCGRNIVIGYYDGLRCLHSLKGKIYYIRSEWTEEDSLLFFVHTNEMVKMAFLEFYRLDYTKSYIYSRLFLEGVCPALAASLRLGKDWTYQDLYIALLELCAKNLKIQKYRVYTELELQSIIKERYGKYSDRTASFPQFIDLVLKMMTI